MSNEMIFNCIEAGGIVILFLALCHYVTKSQKEERRGNYWQKEFYRIKKG